jgi:succinate-semialdehyde dehydrogenase / glutarate-semialdehyde dehydrogenase
MASVEFDRVTLKRADLFRSQGFIDGSWVNAGDGATLEVTNPVSGNLLGTVPNMKAQEAEQSVTAAHLALPAWSSKTGKERSVILRNWFNLIMAHQEDLGRLMTAEQGKPLAEAKGEIAYAASFIEWFSEEAKRIYGDTIPGPTGDRRLMVIKQPVGVVAAITPWNFPAAMITRKAGAALAAGCTMVVKPAAETPYSALALAVLADEAGVPKGVFNVITGDAKKIGDLLTGDARVRKVTFTGSTAVGKILLKQCADMVKKVSMELGGNAPFIVFDDADLDAAVEGAMASKFRNTGQTCVCANRVLVQSGVYDAFAQKLADRVSALKLGDGLKGPTDQGPLINMEAIEKIEDHILDATTKGAEILTGGKRHALGGTFFEPTILTGATPAMKVAKEETFGPLAPLFKFETEADAIAMANDTEFGLASYVYTRDLNRYFRVSEKLEYGMVGINTGLISTELAPFGGMKESGLGREGSKYGVDDYLEIKLICVGGV